MTVLAGCIILDEDGRILLLHRATPELTQWELPGGKLEPGELPEAAAARELTEEVGISVEILAELGQGRFSDGGREWLYHWFLASISSGRPRPVEDKFDAVRYFDVNKLEDRSDVSANVRILLDRFKAGFGQNAMSKIRRTRNELIIQKDNTRIKDLASDLLDRESRLHLPLSFACECSALDCTNIITAPAAVYAKIHDRSGWFAIAPGHEQLDIEQVIEAESARPEFIVVEKNAVKSGQIRET